MYYNAVDERGEIIINDLSARGVGYQFHSISAFGDYSTLYNVTETLFESQSNADSLVKAPTKVLAEACTNADSLGERDVWHSLIETNSHADSLEKGPVVNLADTMTMVDSLGVREVTHILHETNTMLDTVRQAGDAIMAKIYSVTSRLTKNSIVRSVTKAARTGRIR